MSNSTDSPTPTLPPTSTPPAPNTLIEPIDYAMPGRLPKVRWVPTLGWAVYLGVSWTWCIGMFLPVLLVRDYGLLGWVVFALPNVVGAAAMGWVMRSPGDSRSLAAAHRHALAAFSFVTAAFQIFFAMWIFARIGVDGAGHFSRATIALALLVFCYPIARWRSAGPILSAAVYLVSLLCIVFAYRTGEISDGLRLLTSLNHPVTFDLLWLTPVTIFGFLTCPYLDRTFHHARQQLATPAEGKAGFAIGFGVLFFSMIVFTLAYALPVYFALVNPAMGSAVLFWFISIHLMTQLAFTTGVHWSGDGDPRDAAQDAGGGAGRAIAHDRIFYFVLATFVVGLGAYLATRQIRHRDFEPGEVVYRCFMAFYGLVFPAYVWLCMIPTWRDPTPPSRRSLAVFASAVVVAAPMFAVAFLGNRMIWLAPGLLAVLLARFFVRPRGITAHSAA